MNKIINIKSNKKLSRLIFEKNDEKETSNNKSKEKTGDNKESLAKKLGKMIVQAGTKYATDKAGKYLDILMLGQFKDALFDIFNKEKASGLKDDEIQKIVDEVKKDKSYEQGLKNKELDSRKDDNQSTEIDDASRKFYCMWYAGKEADGFNKVINDIVVNIQKTAKEAEDVIKKLKSDLKSMKVEATDDDINMFAPVLIQMVAEKKSAEEITKKISEMKKEVEESIDLQIAKIQYGDMLNEGITLLTEEQKHLVKLCVLLENEDFVNGTLYCINEGIFGKSFDFIKDKVKSFGKKVKDVSAKGLEVVTKSAIMPIYKMAGLGIQALTQGLGPTLIMKVMDAIEKDGKKVRNAFERVYTKFANMGGVAAQMDFNIKDAKDKTYSVRFYLADMVWRVLNIADQLKHPSKDYAKEILNGEQGKKFRERIKEIWDPLFAKDKGGAVDFVELMKQAKGIGISDKQLKMFEDFRNNYDKIISIIEKPIVDTRTKDLKLGDKAAKLGRKAVEGAKAAANKAKETVKAGVKAIKEK